VAFVEALITQYWVDMKDSNALSALIQPKAVPDLMTWFCPLYVFMSLRYAKMVAARGDGM
jgi:hypothetical protein